MQKIQSSQIYLYYYNTCYKYNEINRVSRTRARYICIFFQKLRRFLSLTKYVSSTWDITCDILNISRICLLASRYLEKVRASESGFDSTIFWGNWLSERSFYWKEASLEQEKSYLLLNRFDTPRNSWIDNTLSLINVLIVLQKVGVTKYWSWLLYQ